MNKYVFRPYDPKFPEYFSRHEKVLRKLFGEAVKIEHMGSTSVPGLGGKGFIDIAIGVPSQADLDNAATIMLAAGYNFEPAAGTSTRFYYDCEFIDDHGEVSMYHFHLTYIESEDWIKIVVFRDFLRNNEWARKEYAAIKDFAAKESNQERVKYVKIKNPVIEKILKLALEGL